MVFIVLVMAGPSNSLSFARPDSRFLQHINDKTEAITRPTPIHVAPNINGEICKVPIDPKVIEFCDCCSDPVAAGGPPSTVLVIVTVETRLFEMITVSVTAKF